VAGMMSATFLHMSRWVITALLTLTLEVAIPSMTASAARLDVNRWPITQTGLATFVTRARDGDQSASGEIFEGRKLVAAHRSLPWGSIVRVTNLENGRAVTVRVIDRGPYGRNHRQGTIIDVSRAAARRLKMIHDGKVRVRLTVLQLGSGERVPPRDRNS
jgi:rare lipoprotein A